MFTFCDPAWMATPTALLCRRLRFTQSGSAETFDASTIVACGGDAHFICRKWCSVRPLIRRPCRRFHHSDFDERLHEHHFGIARWWRNLKEQDEIEARFGLVGDVLHGWGWGDPPRPLTPV